MSDATAASRRVQLLQVPTELLVRHRRHLEDLVHELHILHAGAETGEVQPGPRLAALVSEILDAYPLERDAVWRQAEGAAAAGREIVDIDVDLPPNAASVAPQLVDLLEEADTMCRQQQMLTMAAPREVAQLRRWMCAQIVAQVERGETPEPFPR